jgi:glutathione S-transferase
MLEEIGVPYQAVVLPYGHGMKTPEYLAINPMGKVPTLVHGDAVVTEVAAILAYLADVFPQAGLAPRPPPRSPDAAPPALPHLPRPRP